MNREETKECIAVMQAYVDGDPIQCTHRTGQNAWEEGEPEWQWALYQYRTAPKPREFFVPAKTENGERFQLTGKDSFNDGWIKVREIL
jgi:hypothetical protein